MARTILLSFLLLILTACQTTPEQARKELAELGKEFNTTTFLLSAADGDVVVIDLFLTAGMSPDIATGYGKTPLIFAAEHGHLTVVEVLLTNGARVDVWDKEGWNALMYASGGNHIAVAEALLEAGIDVNAQTKEAQIPRTEIKRDHTNQAKVLGHFVLSPPSDPSDVITQVARRRRLVVAVPSTPAFFSPGATALMVAAALGHLDTVVQPCIHSGG